jgi:hypothetical protein
MLGKFGRGKGEIVPVQLPDFSRDSDGFPFSLTFAEL